MPFTSSYGRTCQRQILLLLDTEEPFEGRPLLLFPVVYGLLVPLLSSALWFLQGES
jgi:hypothetical protein